MFIIHQIGKKVNTKMVLDEQIVDFVIIDKANRMKLVVLPNCGVWLFLK